MCRCWKCFVRQILGLRFAYIFNSDFSINIHKYFTNSFSYLSEGILRPIDACVFSCKVHLFPSVYATISLFKANSVCVEKAKGAKVSDCFAVVGEVGQFHSKCGQCIWDFMHGKQILSIWCYKQFTDVNYNGSRINYCMHTMYISMQWKLYCASLNPVCVETAKAAKVSGRFATTGEASQFHSKLGQCTRDFVHEKQILRS